MGSTRYSDIHNSVGADPARALDRLLEAHLIERLAPVTEDPDRSRRRLYRIADNFLAFYLGPVRRHRTEIERGHGRSVMPALCRELDNYMGPAFEEAFRQCLWRMAEEGALGSDIVAIGPWWSGDSQEEIDAVVLAQHELTRVPVAVGEAKWKRVVNGSSIRSRLIAKAAALTDDVDRLSYVVCARTEVRNPDEGTVVITAADIFPDAGGGPGAMESTVR
jgi:hypothetical protein